MEQLESFESLPFKPSEHKKAAIRVVDDRGTTSEAVVAERTTRTLKTSSSNGPGTSTPKVGSCPLRRPARARWSPGAMWKS
jgi:hypothetical protein